LCPARFPGGVVSLLALNGIWHLMQRHNLDYPDFYPKLYSLLTHETLSAPYRHLFFQKLDMFLSSASLASYAAAAFAKRYAEPMGRESERQYGLGVFARGS
jgi:U3 small nucleolar RNA-associated protein 19